MKRVNKSDKDDTELTKMNYNLILSMLQKRIGGVTAFDANLDTLSFLANQ